MRTSKLILVMLAITLAALIMGCNKNNHCDSCENATLYYTPNCSTIKGYVTLSNNNETIVFQHDIDAQFRESGLKVCIIYSNEGSKPLTAECMQGQVIKITCIEKR